MSASVSLRRFIFSPRRLWPLIGVALAASGFVLWQSFLSPTQRHIDEGVQLSQVGRDIEAQSQWKKVVQTEPNNAQAWELLSDSYLSTRDYNAALNALKHVEALRPDTPDLQSRLAVASYQLKRADEAQRYAQAQLKRDPNNIAALQTLATLAAEEPAPLEQLKYLQTLADLQPQNVAVLQALADIRERRNEYDQVLPLAERIVKLAPASSDALLRRGIALYTTNGQPDSMTRAQSDLIASLRLNPGSLEAHRYLARVYLRLNQPRKSIEEFQKLGEGRPYATAHLLEMSNAYRRLGDAKQADKLRAQFIRLKGLNTIWIDLKKQLDRSPDDVAKNVKLGFALTQAVTGEDAAYQLYRYQVATGKLQAAQFYVDKAAQLQPENPDVRAARARLAAVYDSYAKLLKSALQRGDFVAAKAVLPRLVLLRPSDARTLELGRRVTGGDPISEAPLP